MSSSLHEDLSSFYCCRSHKFAIKVFLCNLLTYSMEQSPSWEANQ